MPLYIGPGVGFLCVRNIVKLPLIKPGAALSDRRNSKWSLPFSRFPSPFTPIARSCLFSPNLSWLWIHPTESFQSGHFVSLLGSISSAFLRIYNFATSISPTREPQKSKPKKEGGEGMAEIVISVASKVAEYLVAPVGRQCGYVIFTNSYVGQLDKELEKLDDVRVEVQRSVDHADNNMWEIKREVNRWKNNVETVANEARSLLDNDGRAKKTCFCGWLPNPKGRYCLGRGARKTAQAIQELIPQGKFERVYYESAPPALVGGAAEVNSSACDGGDTIQELIPLGQFKKVDFENPPTVLVGGASGVNSSAGDVGDTITVSRASIFQDIMKALHDEKLKVIGVYGPGGVGKTTLLEEVEKKLRKEGGPFQMIVKAEVLQTPDLNNIQGQIADALKLDLKDKQSQQGRRDHLVQRLQKDTREKILIILDDLWEELDLKAVGIPSGNTSGKCKLLLTSRFKHVLEQKMRADRTFLLEGLNNDEAFGLFEKTVGDRLKDEEELRPIAAQVVKKLAGLPLLIISVACTLKNSGVSAWKNALIKIDVKKMETIVKLSYDHLESEDAKSLFLLCGLIGGTIKVELLLGLGMGLGLFEGFNNRIKDSRDRLNTMLESLHSACLLQDGRDDMKNVTIHDLYSEVVISTPFRGQDSLMMNYDYGSWSKENLEKCWAICLAKLGRDKLAELMTCQFPNMKILMLSQPEDWWWMRGHKHDDEECWGQLDFTCMKKLRVLYLRSRFISTLPSSIEFLGNLHSLYLDQCDVADVKILGKLKALQILSFAWSTVSRLPKEIGELINLRSLNLSNCYRLKTIEPGVLKGLIKLEELYMKESFDQWMGTDGIPSESRNARLAELKSLTRLTTLEISIPEPTILFEDGDLPFGNLIKFWINIGNVEGTEFLGLRTMKLKLEGCDSILLRDWVQKTLQKTQYLHLVGLGEFKKNAHELCIRGFTQLKHLHIQNSPSIKYIASSSSDLPTAFTILESLSLENLINLEKLCNGPVAPDCFSKLKAMHIKRCHRLENLWFLSKMQRLVYLEEIQICECDSLPAIITYDVGKVEVAANDIVQLPDVRHLDLRKLPNMTSFCTGDKGAPIQRMWKQDVQLQGISILQNLKKLSINNTGLSFLFPYSVAKCLREIREIKVEDCPNMKAVIMDEEGRDDETDGILEFPLLERLSISCCPTEKFFSYPHGEKESIVTTSDSKDTYSDSFFDQKISLPSLEELILHSLGSSRHGYVRLGLAMARRGIWHSELPKSSSDKLANLTSKQDLQSQGISIFRNLEVLSINNTGLSFLFSMSVAKSLREIREIKVNDCPNMNAVIVDEEGRDDGIDDIIEFPLLERLSISHCPTEKFFSYRHGKKESITTTSDSKDTYSDSFFNQKVSLSSLQKLLFESVGSFKRIWRGVLPKSSFDKLANLTFSRCSDQLDVFPSTIIGRLHNLKSLKVLECPSLESLFDFGSLDSYMEQTIVLLPELKEVMVKSCPSLESLFSCGSLDSNMKHKIVLLSKLKKVCVSEAGRLRHIVLSDSHTVFHFPSLKFVTVYNCSELRYLFPYYTATTLDKLKLLVITNCKQMKEVVPKEEGGRSKANVMSFPSLTTLIIWWCPNLGAFIRSPTSAERQLGEMIEENDESAQPLFNDMVTSPNMTRLGIKGVQCKELWNDQIPDDSFCNLKSLKLKGCDNLQCIAPSHMWKRLQRCLNTLEVKSCRSIKIIYESDGTVAESGNLMRLVLCDLDNLRHIWRYDSLPNIPFPSLRYVKAIRCSRLEMLFATSTVKFLKQIEELVVGSCEDMELIAGHEECEEATGTTITFSKLNTLRLWNLPKFRSFLPENYSMKFPSLNMKFPSLNMFEKSSQREDESDGESQDESDGESQDESDGESQDESDGESQDESDGESEDESDGESEDESEDDFDLEIKIESYLDYLEYVSEEVSEEESRDEEVMGKLRTKVIGERKLSELEDFVESEEIVSVGESEGNIEFYEG